MKAVWCYLLISAAVLAHSQSSPKPAEAPSSHTSIADFGLVYPLSNDWVRATQLLRKKMEATNPSQNFDVLLAAVYVPKSDMSTTSPFFLLVAYRQPATDCKRSLEAMIAKAQDQKEKPEGGVVEFSAAGRDYFRVNIAHSAGGRHQSILCTTVKGHLLVWNAGAPNEKGLDAVVDTLNSIAPLPPLSAPESGQESGQEKNGESEETPSKPLTAQLERIRVASGVTSRLLIRKVSPAYPVEARAAHIQGTVVLQAEINKSGDIADLELVDGPLELAGSAVAAVRQWKYKPYLLAGQPVTVETQIQVNYELRW